MSELLRIAILGTSQTTGTARSGTEADTLLDELGLEGRGEPERALLLRAGAAAVLRRAGMPPKPWSSSVKPAGAETLQRASASLSGLLAGLLHGDSEDLLVEALEQMRPAGLRFPEELLPPALDEQELTVRGVLLPLLGARGGWLADNSSTWRSDTQQYDAWAWARTGGNATAAVVPADAEAAWEQGSQEEREELLLLGLRSDRGRALRWVSATFRTDKPEQRKRWIELLQDGLTGEEAPFLEAASNDRSATVRLAAARASWRLPGTPISEAARARVVALFRFEPSFTVELPQEPFDRALEKLGIVEAPPEGVGRRQWWLAQLVSAVPPCEWCERFSVSPAALLGLASAHELGFPLLDGWTSAALRFDTTAWLLPLWDVWNRVREPSGWTESEPLERLTERIARGQQRAALEPRLAECIRQSHNAELVALLPRPWSQPLADAFIAALDSRPAWLPRVWSSAATAAPIASVPATFAAPVVIGRRLPIDDAIAKFLSVIELRRRVADEIAAQGREQPAHNPDCAKETR